MTRSQKILAEHNSLLARATACPKCHMIIPTSLQDCERCGTKPLASIPRSTTSSCHIRYQLRYGVEDALTCRGPDTSLQAKRNRVVPTDRFKCGLGPT